MKCIGSRFALLAVLGLVFALPAAAGATDCRQGSVDQRVDCLLHGLTTNEKLQLVLTHSGGSAGHPLPEGALGSAAFLRLPSSLGLPFLQITDAGLGVGNPGNIRRHGAAVSLPSQLATASSWDPDLARSAGSMIGGEAWRQGFNVLLAGGLDLARDPRDGRNFEYAGEDPLLAGRMVGEIVEGIQAQHVVATVKHFAMNDLETSRLTMSANIEDGPLRESDLLAFEIAIETGHPGSVMCSYNRLNDVYACENEPLLDRALKQDWHYPGFVMSDWGGTHSTVRAALAGLDQESAGDAFDARPYFGAALAEAVQDGQVPMTRLDDMARRILHAVVAVGLIDHPPVTQALDVKADLAVAQRDEEEGAVLLRNEGSILPLSRHASLAVIGGHADAGVLSGGGSAQVVPVGGSAVKGPGRPGWPGDPVYDPSSPLAALRAAAPSASIRYASGASIARAAALAAKADVAIVFATQWSYESVDQRDLSLPDQQDRLIQAVARANPHLVVVLETGGPVLMPWLEQSKAVLEAWYPGSEGGPALARLLYGDLSPSGHLPMTFPRNVQQLPRPVIYGVSATSAFAVQTQAEQEVEYAEGADVGYRWFGAHGETPLFPFGAGLTYSSIRQSGLRLAVRPGAPAPLLEASFRIANQGTRTISQVAQLYVTPPGARASRLAGFRRVTLAPGEARDVTVVLEPRVLAQFDAAAGRWQGAAGQYTVRLAENAGDPGEQQTTTLAAWQAPP